MTVNTEFWQADLDSEIIKHAKDQVYLSNIIAVLRAKIESVQFMLEYPEFNNEIVTDVRSQRLVNEIPAQVMK